jgi:hypothetical protein
MTASNEQQCRTLQNFAESLPISVPGLYISHSIPTEAYINGDEMNPYGSKTHFLRYKSSALRSFSSRCTVQDRCYRVLVIYRLPISDFAHRRSVVININWLAGLAASVSTGTLWNTPVDAVLNHSSMHGPFYATSTPANISQTVEDYVCNQAWLAVLVIASTLLLLISIVGTCTKWMTISPDLGLCLVYDKR